jgi:hypothetical protein
MTHAFLYNSPVWFLGYDIFLEVVFALVTLAVALYSFKIYKISDQRESRIFGISFLSISISYSLWAILNGFAVSKLLNESYCFLDIKSATIFSALGIYTHILFFLIGLIALTYMTLKVKSSKIFSLIFALVILPALLIEEKHIVLYLFSSVLLLFIIAGYIDEYRSKKNKKVLLTFFAFVFLFFGRFDFIFTKHNPLFYVAGHFLEMIAYVLILISLVEVIINKPKKSLP